MAVVYHWKHGWIPLDHTAALSKAKGNHELAAKMLGDAHSGGGINSRQDVAKAVRDLPNVPAGDHGHAMMQLRQSAEHHNSTDLIPNTTQVGITQAGFLAHGLNAQGVARQSHGGFTESQRVLSQRTNFSKPGMPKEWVPGHIEKIAHHDDGTADVTIRNDDGTVQVERIGKRGGGGQIKAMPDGAERGSQSDARSVRGQQSAAELAARAQAKREEMQRIFNSTGVPERAAGRLNSTNLARAHRNTDSALRRYTEAEQQAQALEHKAALAAHREAESARQHFTPDELKGAKFIQTDTGWHEVVRVNGKTVTVKTPYSWTDSIALKKILKVAKPGSEPGKSRIHGPGGS